MKYKILKAQTSIELEIEVNNHMKTGWEPHGSLHSVLVEASRELVFYQPIIKEF